MSVSRSFQKGSSNPARILRKLRPSTTVEKKDSVIASANAWGAGNSMCDAVRAESTEASSASVEVLARSSTGSVHSRVSNQVSPEPAAGAPARVSRPPALIHNKLC